MTSMTEGLGIAPVEELPRLDFLNPVGHEIRDEANHAVARIWTTCRKGTKWADRVARGSIVALATTDGPFHGVARVVELFVGPFRAAPVHYIELNHDPEARSFPGLEAIMRETYGAFDIDDVVTCLALETIVLKQEVQKPEPQGDAPVQEGVGAITRETRGTVTGRLDPFEGLPDEPQDDGAPYRAEAEADDPGVDVSPRGDSLGECCGAGPFQERQGEEVPADGVTRESRLDSNTTSPLRRMFQDRPFEGVTYAEARAELGLAPLREGHPLASRSLADVLGDQDATVQTLRQAARDFTE